MLLFLAVVLSYTKTPIRGNIHNADLEIMMKIQESLWTEKDVDLSEVAWKQDRHDVPCVVFCVYASRLEADVEEALPDLKGAFVWEKRTLTPLQTNQDRYMWCVYLCTCVCA